MNEKTKPNPREVFQRRLKASKTQDLLGDLTDDIQRAGAFKLEPDPEVLEEMKAVKAKASKPRTEKTERKPDPNRKTIRLHPDVRTAIQRHADSERRNFTDVLKEVLVAGMRDKGISID